MGNPNKDSKTTETGAEMEGVDTAHKAHQAACNLSWEREARDATLAKQVAEAVAREMAKAHVHYQAILNERGTAAMPTSLQMTSGAIGFKLMDPFDWTKDKAIYQRWQMWSEKARHAFDAMEGDSEKTKISYFHHWIDGEGMGKTESWRKKRYSLARRTMINLRKMKKKTSTLQKRLLHTV